MRTDGKHEHIDQEKDSRELPQKRGKREKVKEAVAAKKWDRSENRRKPSMAAAWVERGAVTSTIAAGSLRRIEVEEEKGAGRERSIMRKKDQWESTENRSANSVARDAAFIISNGSCELFLSIPQNCFPTIVRNNLCSHWRLRACVCVEKARKWTRNRVMRCHATSRRGVAVRGKERQCQRVATMTARRDP